MDTKTLSTPNGAFVSGGPLTTEISNQMAPGLLQNAIDRRIVKIRPIATPIDQISRCAGSRSCGSMKVEYYSVDSKPVSSKVTSGVVMSRLSCDEGNTLSFRLLVDNGNIFEPSETLLVPSVMMEVTKPGGRTETSPMVLYVNSRDSISVNVVVLNNIADPDTLYEVAAKSDLPAGAEIVRMGRAATELDVQTAQFEALPVKKSNFCQIFKMQVEQSTFQKLSNKEVNWSFSDQEEVAVADMRMGMEKSFLFGTKARFHDTTKHEDVLFTGGIWYQAENEFEYNPDSMNEATLIDLTRKAFTGNAAGSARKILVAGSELMSVLSKIQANRTLGATQTLVKWGLEFHEIVTNFGRLYVIHSEVFDQCGHASDGIVIDPDLITKYVHVPFHTESLDLRRAGVRNTDAIVVTEASCLVLRHPTAHMRVVAG